MLDSRCSKSAACLHDLARSSHDIGENGDGEFEEADPAGRYIRYKEVLGRGAFKTVYRAFDEVDGIEVAWNQIKLRDVVRSPEDLERLYSEVHLLKTLKHRNIIKFYHSWVDVEAQNLNFITEIFTSGTLKQYRKRHKCVDIRAVKNWSRQILRGLLYLHSHDPPIIHRDLKCDNIFINGNHGEVKIGDLGLATMLRHAHSAHSVIGTPEFMAPELYEEEYNELIDIYSFGMCLLEMITSEYPYSECTNAAQIYKKVTSGRKPAALDRVEDPDLRNFVEKCLATASRRLPARELLMDPFLQCNGSHDTLEPSPVMSGRASSVDDVETLLLLSPIQPSLPFHDNALQSENLCNKSPAFGMEEKKGRNRSIDFRVKGKRRENDIVHLRLRIADAEGQVRHIHFPFDIEADTAMCVASEMVAELDLADQDVTVIAEMIDASILAMVPEWRPGVAIDEPYTDGEDTSTYESAHDSITNKHWHPDHLSTVSSESTLMDQSQHGSTSWHDATSFGTPAQADNMMHGRFEEVMYYHHRPEGRANLEDDSMVSTELWDGGPPDESSASVSPTSSDAKAVCGPQVFMYNELVNSKVKIRLTRCNGKRWIPGLHIRNMAVHKGKPKHVDCLDTEPDGHTSRQLNYDLGGEDDDDQNESIAHELQELVSDYQQELKTLQREHEAALLKWRRKWQDKGASLDFLKLQEEKLFSGDEHGVGLVSTSI